MCKAIEDMKTNAKNEGRAEGRAEGMAEGMNKGILETLVGLVKDGLIPLAEAAKRANMTVSDFEDKTGLKAEK